MDGCGLWSYTIISDVQCASTPRVPEDFSRKRRSGYCSKSSRSHSGPRTTTPCRALLFRDHNKYTVILQTQLYYSIARGTLPPLETYQRDSPIREKVDKYVDTLRRYASICINLAIIWSAYLGRFWYVLAHVQYLGLRLRDP